MASRQFYFSVTYGIKTVQFFHDFHPNPFRWLPLWLP